MRKIILTTLLAFTCPLFAGEKVDKNLDAAADGTVNINNVRGNITVHSWKKNIVNVNGTLDDETEEFIFERSGNTINIMVNLEKKKKRSGEGSDLVILIPEKSQLQAKGVSTDFMIKDIYGGISLTGVSSDITASNIKNGLTIKTVSGDIRLEDASGNAQFKTVSGDINADLDADKVSLKTTSGDALVSTGNSTKINATTVSGDITISSKPKKKHNINIKSVSGDVEFIFGNKPNSNINIRTVSGDKINKLANRADIKIIKKSKQSLQLQADNGEGDVNIKTVSGDVNLK